MPFGLLNPLVCFMSIQSGTILWSNSTIVSPSSSIIINGRWTRRAMLRVLKRRAISRLITRVQRGPVAWFVFSWTNSLCSSLPSQKVFTDACQLINYFFLITRSRLLMLASIYESCLMLVEQNYATFTLIFIYELHVLMIDNWDNKLY